MGNGNILLNDLLRFTTDQEKNVKVRFMMKWSQDPIEIYLENPSEINEVHLLNRKKSVEFGVGTIVVALVRMQSSDDDWLLTGVRVITKVLEKPDANGVGYEAEDLQEFKPYFGRTVVRYHNTMTGSKPRWYAGVKDSLVVSSIMPDPFKGEPFPGFDKVCISYRELANILDNNRMDWINAFRSQKAVYLITDTSNGKLYVGSATACADSGMLLSRWRTYAEGGTGGNKELVELVEEKGIEYVQENFQYSILENYNERTDDDYILHREAWWKKLLDSRAHGYNAN